ncbi:MULTISPECIES: 6,7-dimethyl-8-ribityllumazine synthase [Roseobacteraceae]|jgi:6,7-dimethyl-8-ribityllumazine synthase|uniref:6,7-dimethyl-8-ribityllumazine synthase n=1 Tax=Celeribacter baekdonensis B30 TaxID=1208323 RepID=K2J4Y8_9RHOB|nr:MULTISPECIES: 6,7-dimethyl-8-ribityllumazine synthase [Roseobacteraceae]EKE69982.1 6,7-dimethyl-8-ribityllumazine synthase [Celeribacter baekdonensis B30]KAB6717821.1 6,7-dimethyl-8-ribityllumazine synthase [Roseobacter sp. TSBP12]|tara:strand:+ start:633 stop:1193 length:561 start_codon:yes stop_codon:yes gene_type:complete
MAANEQHHILDLPTFDKPVKLLIVVAPYYKDIADELVAGAKAVTEEVGGTWDLVEVPGALEVPTAISIADKMSNFDGYVALGCVIRGETTHYDTVCNDSSRALQLMGLQGLCIGNGILTVENRDQAVVRAEAKGQNKGGGAAAAALHLIALSRKWANPSKGVGFHSDAIRLAQDTQASESTGPKNA